VAFAAAGGHIEHLVVRPHVGGLDEVLADDLERGADDGEVAAGPAGLLALPDGGQAGGRPGSVRWNSRQSFVQ
jgi:hypothetical protein